MTALPHAFYPESSWLDDMQLGSAELALAAHRLGVPAGRYLRDSARFARRYLGSHSTDTLNLYDTGALADVSLASAMSRIHTAGPLAVTRHDLARNLRSQILRGVRHARHDVFGAAASVDEFDVNSHTFGLIASVGLYDALTHSDRFQRFASEQRTWLLGGDPWGVTAMVGVGHAFPNCMQHQVANLSGQPRRHARRSTSARWSTARTGRATSRVASAASRPGCATAPRPRGSSPGSTATAAATSTTSAPGRPTSRRST